MNKRKRKNLYKDLTIETIEKAIGELMMRKVPERRNVKLYVSFPDEEAAIKWFKEFWNPLLKETFEKQINNNKNQ